MSGLLENIRSKRNPIELIVIGAGALAFFGILLFGGEKLVILLNGLCVAAGLFFIAYRYPWAMVILWGFTTQVLVEIIIWDYSHYVEPSLNIGGGIDMLYGDPVLFAIVAAMVVKVSIGDDRAKATFFKSISIWSLFFLWMIFELVRSTTMFGIVSPLGEFRTYFREILIVPYVMIFARTRQEQWKVFKALLWITLILIPIGLFRGAYVHKFRFAAYAKWLYQHGSLGLLWGCLAVYMMQRFGLWKSSKFKYSLVIGLSMALTVIASHRSVWLAAMVSIFFIFLMGHMRLGTLVKMGMVMMTAALIINFAVEDLDLAGFIEDRLVALTNPTHDETANWRYLIWQDAIEQSKSHLLEGKGLGNYFTLRAPNGLIVTKMLHNQYVQLLYQIGLIGLILYLAFAFQMYRRMKRTYRETADPFYKMASILGIVILLGASAYYIAYDYDPFTWLFVGLAMAVAQSHEEDKAAMQQYLRAVYTMDRPREPAPPLPLM